MNQSQILMSISIPCIFFSALFTFLIMMWKQPIFKRPFLLGLLMSIILMGVGIGLVFASIYLAAVWFSIFGGAEAMWIWFMTQPPLKKYREKIEKRREMYHGKRK